MMMMMMKRWLRISLFIFGLYITYETFEELQMLSHLPRSSRPSHYGTRSVARYPLGKYRAAGYNRDRNLTSGTRTVGLGYRPH